MMKTRIALGNKGFTLVELLIVVAIIGVLSTQGVPAYRRMIQKSRKGEAKVLLGNIATAESAFFSEYQTFGNRLVLMGAQMDGGANLIYRGGFPTAACLNQAILPTNGNATSPALTNATYGAYYAALVAGVDATVLGRAALDACNIAGMSNTNAVFAGAAIGGGTYQANVSGNIVATGGNDVCAAAGAAVCDVWTITNNRVLNNSVDGTN